MCKDQIVRTFARWIVVLPLLVGTGCASKTDDPAASGAAADGAKAAADGGKADGADPGPKAESLPKADALLSKAVEAAGGAEAFAKVKSFYYEGQLVIASQKLEARSKVWWKEGNFYTEQDMVGVGEVRAGKKGESIWSSDPINGQRVLTGLEAEQVAWASSLMIAADWKRYFDKAETVKEDTIDGKKVYIVKLTSKSGGEMELQFDVESGLQTGFSFVQETAMGKMPISLSLQDYREVGGVKLAYKQITEMPIASATLEIMDLKLNPEISDARFEMPRADAEVVAQPPAAKP